MVSKFDASATLIDSNYISDYLSKVLVESPSEFPTAVGTILRSRGVAETARQTGLTRETLYSAFKDGGNPTFATILKMMNNFNVHLSVKA